jgi:hypothetical protein
MLGENEWEAKHGALLGLELLIQSGKSRAAAFEKRMI